MTESTFLQSVSDAEQVRRVHLSLQQLGLKSPLDRAAEQLARIDKLSFARQLYIGQAHTTRAALAADIAAGKRDFDQAAIDAWRQTDGWVAAFNSGDTPAAVGLYEAAARSARASAVGIFNSVAGTVFDTVAEAVQVEVRVLEQLPPVKDTLWAAADQLRTLAATEGHAQTLSTLTRVDERWNQLQHIADLVRDAAGFGGNHLPDGAPRLAFQFRNWRVAWQGREENVLNPTHDLLRLWRTVVLGWEPGCWKPSEIAQPTAAENRFGSRLQRLGTAVGVNI